MIALLTRSTIIPAIAGDYLTSSDLRAEHHTEHVRADCGSRVVAFYCLSCRVRLANPYQLELHTEQGQHVVAKLCNGALHGAEALTVPVPA